MLEQCKKIKVIANQRREIELDFVGAVKFHFNTDGKI